MSSIKNAFFFFITLTLGVVFFMMISGKVDWGDVTASLSLVRAWQFIFLFVLTLIIHGAATFAWQDILRHMGYLLPRRKLWRILIVGFTVSFITPVAFIGGEALVLYLLKREMKVPWHRGINSLIVLKLADFIFHVVFILAGLVTFLILTNFAGVELVSALVLVPLGLAAFLIYFFTRVSRRKSVVKPALRLFGLSRLTQRQNAFDLDKEEGEIISFFHVRNRKAWMLMGATFLKYFASWAQAFFLLFFLSGEASIPIALAIHAFAGLSVVLLLPATLGGLELLQVFAFGGLGLSSGLAVSFSLVWRGMRLLICVLSVGYFFFFAGKMVEGKAANVLKRFVRFSEPEEGS